MIHKTFVAIALTITLFAGPALAMGTGGGEGPVPSSEQPLQSLLDELVVSGPPISVDDAISSELFRAGSTGITAQMVSTSAENEIYFGIYPGADPTTTPLLLWNGMATSDVVAVSFLDDGSITFGGPFHGSRNGFDGPFGFVAKVINDDESRVWIFSEDSLNGGSERMKIFQGNGSTVIQIPGLQAGTFRPDQLLVAIDADGDGEFGDMMVAIAGIEFAEPVPEPATMLLFGLSLLTLVPLRRS